MAPYILGLAVLGLISFGIGLYLWRVAIRMIANVPKTADRVGRANFERANAQGVQEFESWEAAKKVRTTEYVQSEAAGCGAILAIPVFLIGVMFMAGTFLAAQGILEILSYTEAEFQAEMNAEG